MAVLIGSRALAWWNYCKGLKVKDTADWDIIIHPDLASFYMKQEVDPEAFSWKYGTWRHGNIEFHNELKLGNDKIAKLYGSQYVAIIDGIGLRICNMRGLAAIKRSHLHRNIGFTKHMIHYQMMMDCGVKFNETDLAYIKERIELTKQAFPERPVFGNMTNEEFVDDAVTRHFDHEELHKIITDGNVSYFKLKRDFSRAAYEHDLWHAASDELKQKCVREETYVIALERYLIPMRLKGRKYPYAHAYVRALEKVCTTLDDGPLREYAIDNWNTVKQFDGKVFDKFFDSQLWRTNDYAERMD